MRRLAAALLPVLAPGPRPPGPCSAWFDNAWLKSEGFSADACCWGNHSRCWQDDYTYDACCGDYDTRWLEQGLETAGYVPLPLANLGAALALEEGPDGIGFSLGGLMPLSPASTEQREAAAARESPRSFFQRMAPSVAALLQAVSKHDERAEKGGGLVLVIMTAPGNFARRAAIRKSWLQTLGWEGAEDVRYVFVVAAPDALTRARVGDIDQQLRQEQSLHRDVLVLPSLEDVYWGWEHTAKTFLALLAALERSPEAEHFACLHDDVYVNVPRLVESLRSLRLARPGLYFGNAYTGHQFVGHAPTDGADYEAMHGHRQMPVVMKGGLWVIDRLLATWVASAMGGPAALVPWKLWASDDDSVGLVFGELDLERRHGLRHGVEWFDWRLGDHCDGERLIIAHDLKTPRELMDIWARQLLYDNACHDAGAGIVRWKSRPEDFVVLE